MTYASVGWASASGGMPGSFVGLRVSLGGGGGASGETGSVVVDSKCNDSHDVVIHMCVCMLLLIRLRIISQILYLMDYSRLHESQQMHTHKHAHMSLYE